MGRKLNIQVRKLLLKTIKSVSVIFNLKTA